MPALNDDRPTEVAAPAPWDEGYVETETARAIREERQARDSAPLHFVAPTRDDLRTNPKLRESVLDELGRLASRDLAHGLYAEALNPQPGIAVLSQSELLNRPDPEWWVEGWLQKGTVAMVAGPPGLGKSFYVLNLGLCLATGQPVWRRSVSKARVLYVVAEGASAFGKRARAWHDAFPYAVIPEGGIGYIEKGVNLSDSGSIAELRKVFIDGDYDLLILDTYSQLSGVADENAAAENSRVLNAVRSIREAKPGASVIVVHHTDARGTKARGSTTLTANVDTVLMLKPNSSGGWSVSTLLGDGGKQKDGKPERTDGYFLEDRLDSAVVRWSGTTPVSPYWAPILEVLADGGWHSGTELRESCGIPSATGKEYDQMKADRAKWVSGGLLEKRGSVNAPEFRLAPGTHGVVA